MDSNKCCLCLDNTEELLEILGDDGLEKNICDIIKEHFSFIAKLYGNDFIHKWICLSCCSKSENFHEFYKYIKVKQIKDSIAYKQQEVTIIKVELEEQMQEESQQAVTIIKIELEEQLESENIVNISKCMETEQPVAICFENNETNADMHVSEDELPLSKLIKKEQQTRIRPKRQIKKRKNTKEILAKNSKEIPEIKANINELYIAEECEDSVCEDEVVESENEEENELDDENISSTKTKLNDEEQIRQFFNMFCDLCESEKFQTFRDVKAHYLSEHKIEKGYVICCQRKFKTLATIREHMIWHANPESFTCKLCKKVFVNKIGLNYHMLNHEPESNRPHKCNICFKGFAKFYQMNQHKVSHSYSAMDKKFKCETCGNSFPTPSHLRTHTRVVHDAVYAHVCEICAKVFKSKLVFDRHHNELHLGIKPQKMQCQQCGSWIKNETYMRKHMRRHEEASKDFICKFCGKRSPSREALRSHERYVHISERKFKCSYCEKAFRKPKELREHITLHTDEVLYKCMFCPKTFNSNANMYSHQSKVHRLEWIAYKTRENI